LTLVFSSHKIAANCTVVAQKGTVTIAGCLHCRLQKILPKVASVIASVNGPYGFFTDINLRNSWAWQ
jgi:hypothetical protein